MTSHSLNVRFTTISWGVAVAILMGTLSCDTFGPEPKPLPLPAVPEAPEVPQLPQVPATPNGPEVAAAPMAPILRGQIVFVDPWEGAIFVADSTGRRIQRVSQSSGAVDLAVSADGKNIAFSRFCDSTAPCSQMYIMIVDGIDPLLLQTGDTRDWPARPAWSPDGKRIAFVQGRIGPRGFESRHIYTINADGTGLTQLTHSGYNEWPAWSPDGSKILFARSEDDPLTGLHYGILEMDPDGSNVHQLRSGFRDR